jgi:hypothetical protein
MAHRTSPAVCRRIRLIHWRAAEAAPLQAKLELAGHHVDYVERVGSRLMGHLRDTSPDVIVIDLSRLPSHGRMVAAMIRSSRYAAIPIVFVHGDPAKVADAFPEIPHALNVDLLLHQLIIVEALAPSPKAKSTIARPDLSTARKLGIAAGVAVSVVDAPRGYLQALGPLPDQVELYEVEAPGHPLTLWFVRDLPALEQLLPQARHWAARTKLWILWRKGGGELTQLSLRRACKQFALVDYKICSVDSVWSAMLFTRKS